MLNIKCAIKFACNLKIAADLPQYNGYFVFATNIRIQLPSTKNGDFMCLAFQAHYVNPFPSGSTLIITTLFIAKPLIFLSFS